jgi:hypothetical protein
MAWTQQWTLLRETKKNPDPIKSFCEDLTTEMKNWSEKGYEIILMIDANEKVGLRPGGFNSVISKAGLFDLLDDHQKATNFPNTYAREPNESITFSERNELDNTAYPAESSLLAMVIQAIIEQFLSDATLKRCYVQIYIH